MDDHPKFTQIELRSGLVLLPPGYTPTRVARDHGKKKRGTTAGGGTEHPPSRPAPVRAKSIAAELASGAELAVAWAAAGSVLAVGAEGGGGAAVGGCVQKGGNGGGGYGNAGRGGTDAGWLRDCDIAAADAGSWRKRANTSAIRGSICN
ncbi:Os07g0603400 [Oryza sativa Japonica Group]|jgi:hypothetical protein|uniref:Uncharacterized protein n=3 Tax=Oryza TaxID=4527 RepID=A0A8J8YIE4_ORYSJ|nr:hypothetical protein OsJ_25030 [Oryza sativa Japonica Group]BAT02538.1 Os07g0603400 [Oryza sativa Japonica Group]